MESRDKSTAYESNMLYGLRDSRSSFFSQAALDVTRQISLYYDFDINSEIGVALQHAAARQTNANELISILKKKPHLLLQRGRVITSEGNDVRGVTLYEFPITINEDNFDQLTNDFRKFREQYAPHIRDDYLHKFIHRWIKFMIDFFESKASKLMNLTGNVSSSKVTITYFT